MHGMIGNTDLSETCSTHGLEETHADLAIFLAFEVLVLYRQDKGKHKSQTLIIRQGIKKAPEILDSRGVVNL